MNVTMNGLRKNLTSATTRLKDTILDVESNQDEVNFALNDVISLVNSLNCVFIEGDESFTDLSDDYWVDVIEDDE